MGVTEPPRSHQSELDPAICEQARLARDPRFDGRFFVGVVTTGVYCRPICPVRPPKPRNVRFFASAAAAARAGFRPCLRCRPEAAPGTPAWIGSPATVTRALRLIADGVQDEEGVAGLAARLGMGDRHLRRLFLRHLGATPSAVAKTRRLHLAKRLVDDTCLPMADVAFAAGFGSVRRFNAAFRETYGRPPTELRRGRRTSPPSGEPGLTLKLPFRPPLDWQALLDFLAARAIPGVEEVEGTTYRRLFELDGRYGALAVTANADRDRLEVRVDLSDPRPLVRVVERLRSLFDLDADPAVIGERLAADPRLARYLGPGALRDVRVPGAWDGFETAVRAILGQQVTVRGATTLAGRLVQRFGTPLAPPVELAAPGGLSAFFPRPAVLAGEDLSVVGMPRSRAETLRRLAEEVAAGRIELLAGNDPERVKRQLLALPGIGPWTAEYVAMRALREPDAFPASDLGLRKGLANGDGPLSAGQVERLAEDWRPWRAYAAMAVWRGGPGGG